MPRTPTQAPRLAAVDSSLSLLREGYPFISRRAREFHSDLFLGRLMGESVVFLTGAPAAELFYDETRFRRAGAVPAIVRKTLFGEGGVQGLDDEAHRQRKAMFMALMSKANIARFLELADSAWRAAVERWQREPQVVLQKEAEQVLCEAACAWSGIQLGPGEREAVAQDCASLVSGFTSIGPRMWRARAARSRRERWAGELIERTRTGALQPPSDSALAVFAAHRQLDGAILPTQIAAVELLNIVRPIIAIGRWIAYLALALRDHPRYLDRLPSDERLNEAFVQEVRRFYPFTPLLGARARVAFEWQGANFHAGQLVVLDVYGTLRDARRWDEPETFLAERFLEREPTPFDFIPHGGGDFLGGHRCAGEWLTIEIMKQALHLLTRQIRYELPAQDLSYSLSEIPAGPKSGVVIRHVALQASPPDRIVPVSLRGLDGAQADRIS